ncbi:DnaJ family domain-containing protein [Nocardioides ungokensis]
MPDEDEKQSREDRTPEDRAPELDERTGRSAAAARMQHQAAWVDQQIRVAMAKGEFDDLPGAGKPIKDLGSQHDPDWWLKKLVEREQITGVLPPSLALRKEDAELDDRLDTLNVEAEVRRELEDFNSRVIAARYQLPEGPPLITMPRDVEEAVAQWRERRTALRARRADAARATPAPEQRRRRRRWWRR